MEIKVDAQEDRNRRLGKTSPNAKEGRKEGRNNIA
jgi:hypothetical protein